MTAFRSLMAALTPKQLALVVAVQFVTIIGAVALAIYFRNRNRKAA